MYRAVTLFALNNKLMAANELDSDKLVSLLKDIEIHFERNSEGELQTFLNGKNVSAEIRTFEVSKWASPVSAIPEVRRLLVAMQQQMGEQKGVVMDGRDIGTTVFPDAELKIFVTADVDIRTQRRYDEMLAKGESVDFEAIKQNLQTRDHIDQTRKESPLRKANDALVLDNSNLNREEQLQIAYD